MMMGQRRTCRVVIISQQRSFENIVVKHLRHWGYEVEVLPSLTSLRGDVLRGDVVLYDLDEAFSQPNQEENTEQPLVAQSRVTEIFRYSQEHGPIAPFTIALSTRSVSRTTLEQLGAIAFLAKPFDMRRLERYLRILQQLLFAEEHNLDYQGKRKTRVLVVDDNEMIVDAIQQYLLDESVFEVVVARDGLEAVEQYLIWRPECIVTDLIMPWMNGYQLMRCLANSSIGVMPAFVVISALNDLEYPLFQRYREGQVVVFENKPFEIEHLLTAIEQALHSAGMTTRPLA